jgi:hypothetical protein
VIRIHNIWTRDLKPQSQPNVNSIQAGPSWVVRLSFHVPTRAASTTQRSGDATAGATIEAQPAAAPAAREKRRPATVARMTGAILSPPAADVVSEL